MTERRYDKEEDRANDIKKHDNPNHESQVATERKLEEANVQIKEAQIEEKE